MKKYNLINFRNKLWVAMVCCFTVIMLILAITLSGLLEKFYYLQRANELITNGKKITTLIAEKDINQEKIDFASQIINAHLIVINSNREIEICNNMMGMSHGAAFKLEDLEKVFNGKIIIKNDYYEIFNARMLAVGIPIRESNHITKAMVLYKPITSITNTMNLMKEYILYASILAFILAGFISFLISRQLTKPLLKLNQVAMKMAKGNFDTKVVINSNDEIGTLGKNINNLSTNLKEHMAALAEEKNKFANVLLSMTDGVISLDREGEVIFFNPQAQKVFCGCIEINIGSYLFECNRFQAIFKDFQLVIETGSNASGSLRAGDSLYRVKLSPLIPEDSQEMLGVIIIIVDVTKDQKLEEMRKDFIANVSHELRTPLSLMQGYTEALLDGFGSNKDTHDSIVNTIHEETLRLKKLVDELLDLSKLQSGKFPLDLVPVDLNNLIQEIEEWYRPTFLRKGLNCHLNLEENMDFLYLDPNRIKQVLINLIENSLKFTTKGGISLSSFSRSNKVWVEVADTGCGIPKEELELIWERFHKEDKSHNRALGGTGIGLSIVKSIIQEHGGEVWVKSEVGKGSIFCFSLPQNIKDDSVIK